MACRCLHRLSSGAVAKASAENSTLAKATVELLLGLPALFHRQDPSRPPSIYNPFGELRPGHIPPYNKILLKRGDLQNLFEGVIPIMYLLLWAIDIFVYFVVVDGEPVSVMLDAISNGNATNTTM